MNTEYILSYLIFGNQLRDNRFEESPIKMKLYNIDLMSNIDIIFYIRCTLICGILDYTSSQV